MTFSVDGVVGTWRTSATQIAGKRCTSRRSNKTKRLYFEKISCFVKETHFSIFDIEF